MGFVLFGTGNLGNKVAINATLIVAVKKFKLVLTVLITRFGMNLLDFSIKLLRRFSGTVDCKLDDWAGFGVVFYEMKD